MSAVAPATARSRRPAAARRARRRRAGRTGWNLLGLVVLVVMLFPVYWMVTTAFKKDEDINSLRPSWFPFDGTLSHFREAIAGSDHPYFWNSVETSLIVVGVTVGLAMLLAFLAAIALAKYRFSGRKMFVAFVIAIQMLPQIGLVIPLFVVLRNYGFTGNNSLLFGLIPGNAVLFGLILTYLTFVLPFAVWTLRGFLLGIPKDLEEAAMVDGSSRLGAFFRILLPLVAPGLVATSVFVFVTTWNEFIFANVLLQDQSKQTVTVWLSYFTGSSRHTDWGALMAASTVIAVPVMLFFLLVQRKMRFGLTAGAVKG
jgi:N,N'-diacetylchitobiose transport system permease protein